MSTDKRNDFNEQIALIQDRYFCKLAEPAALHIIDLLQKQFANNAFVIDICCGSGKVIHHLNDKGFDVLGIDISENLLKLARRKNPGVKFICANVNDVLLPSCQCVISTDIALNYITDIGNVELVLSTLFEKIYHTLENQGLFIFDLLIIDEQAIVQNQVIYKDNPDWSLVIERTENIFTHEIQRQITLFSRINEVYIKESRIDKTISYDKQIIIKLLEQVGFKVEIFTHYGEYQFNAGHVGFHCQK